jgi:hypothetical protein
MLIFSYLKEIIIAIIGFFALYLFNRNKSLKTDNQTLKENLQDQSRLINIQAKVLDVSENVKPTNLDSNLERLSDKTK